MRRPLLSTLAITALCAASAFAQAPGEYEMELWRSAARLDTRAAYEAYLRAFPTGAFADMARAGLARTAASPAGPGAAPPAAPATPAAPAAPAAAPAAGPVSALAPFAGPVNSGSTDLALGDRLVGPGVIMVGNVGNRRQLVVPAGEWVLLAAEDHATKDRVPVSMATLAFGQFQGSQLRSLLVATFNRRSVATQSGSPGNALAGGQLPTWRQAQRCEAAAPAHGLPETTTSRWLRRCVLMRSAGDWLAAFPEAAPLAEPVAASLAALKGKLPPAFAHLSEVHMSDVRYGYAGLTRLDTAEVGSAADRAAWLRGYAALAERGYTRDFSSNDLVPGATNPTREFELPY